jgi:hypothetical protein
MPRRTTEHDDIPELATHQEGDPSPRRESVGTIRRLRRHLFPRQTREDIGPMAGGFLQALGPVAGAAGQVGAGAGFLRQAGSVIRGTTRSPAGNIGRFRDPLGRMRSTRAGAAGETARSSVRETAAATARSPVSIPGAAATVVGGELVRRGSARAEAERQEVPEQAPPTGEQPQQQEPMGPPRSLRSATGIMPEDRSPGGVGFSGGERRELPGRLRADRIFADEVGPDGVPTFDNESIRRRQEMGILPPDRPPSMEEQAESLQRSAMTLQQRQFDRAIEAMDAPPSAAAQALGPGIPGVSDMPGATPGAQPGTEGAAQPARSMDEVFNPETMDRVSRGIASDMQQLTGRQLDDNARQEISDQFGNFLRRGAADIARTFGIPADPESMRNHAQPIADLFAAGMMVSALSGQTADRTNLMRDALARGGGIRARRERAIFDPDNPTETAANLKQLAEGIKAHQEGGDTVRESPDAIRRRRVRFERGRPTIAPIHEVVVAGQPIRIDNIPPQVQQKLLRAYNELTGQQRG